MFKYLQNKDAVILTIDFAANTTMTFKNGSIIKTVPLNNSETIRGKRSTLPIYYDDFEFNEKEFNKILEGYMNKEGETK